MESSSVSSTDENHLDERFGNSVALKCKLCSVSVVSTPTLSSRKADSAKTSLNASEDCERDLCSVDKMLAATPTPPPMMSMSPQPTNHAFSNSANMSLNNSATSFKFSNSVGSTAENSTGGGGGGGGNSGGHVYSSSSSAQNGNLYDTMFDLFPQHNSNSVNKLSLLKKLSFRLWWWHHRLF